MIIDHIKNVSFYGGIHPGIDRALEYLSQTDLAALDSGRYALDGDRVFALVQRYDTKPREQGVWEAHRRYIDVQYVAAGLERMGYAPLESLTVTQPYVSDKDCELLAGNGDFILASAGTFAVFFPQDAHMPGLACEQPRPVVKVVVKVEATATGSTPGA